MSVDTPTLEAALRSVRLDQTLAQLEVRADVRRRRDEALAAALGLPARLEVEREGCDRTEVLDRFLSRGESASDRFEAERGDGILRERVEAAVATILINSEIGKVCIITVCGGSDMKRWLPLIGLIEAYAKREGCKRVRIYGRKGWLRVLKGYEEKHVIMDRALG